MTSAENRWKDAGHRPPAMRRTSAWTGRRDLQPNDVVSVLHSMATPSNVAVADVGRVMCSRRRPVPQQAPPQPVTVELWAGTAAMTTIEPDRNVAEHARRR